METDSENVTKSYKDGNHKKISRRINFPNFPKETHSQRKADQGAEGRKQWEFENGDTTHGHVKATRVRRGSQQQVQARNIHQLKQDSQSKSKTTKAHVYEQVTFTRHSETCYQLIEERMAKPCRQRQARGSWDGNVSVREAVTQTKKMRSHVGRREDPSPGKAVSLRHQKWRLSCA